MSKKKHFICSNRYLPPFVSSQTSTQQSNRSNTDTDDAHEHTSTTSLPPNKTENSMSTPRNYKHNHTNNKHGNENDQDGGSGEKQTRGGDDAYALVMLNQEFDRLFEDLFKGASLTICADGGSNRLYDHFSCSKEKEEISEVKADEDRKQFVPDVIVGDLDSARPQVLEFYQAQGCTVKHIRDQDTTDMQKALTTCLEIIEQRQDLTNTITCIVFYASFGGRFDHQMANVNTLYSYLCLSNPPTHGSGSSIITEEQAPKVPPLRLCLLSDGNYVELLAAGSNVVHCHPGAEKVGTHCGLLPVKEACDEVHTSGLRWNLNGESMSFGGLVSSCNIIDASTVYITTSQPLLWTTSYGELL